MKNIIILAFFFLLSISGARAIEPLKLNSNFSDFVTEIDGSCEEATMLIIATGKVVACDNTPLAGVTVSIQGTTTNTTTDAYGNYSISPITNGTVLVFFAIGFQTVEITIDNPGSCGPNDKCELPLNVRLCGA